MNPLRIHLGEGIPVDLLRKNEVLALFEDFLSSSQPHQIITFNSLMALEAMRDQQLATIIQNAFLVVADSIGIALACWMKAGIWPQRIPGVDLMLDLCALAQKKACSVFLLGAKQGVAEKCAQNLRSQFPGLQIAGTEHGYFTDDKAVVERVRKAGPHILFVALDSPRQEKWIAKHLEELGVSLGMGVGGSFDVLSGNLRRAPDWMRKMGLEWLFRLLKEPWRLQRAKKLPWFICRLFLG